MPSQYHITPTDVSERISVKKLNFRTKSTYVSFKIVSNGSLIIDENPLKVRYDMKEIEDMLDISIGPKDNYNGIKACLTYNPTRPVKPGYQTDRAVSLRNARPICLK